MERYSYILLVIAGLFCVGMFVKGLPFIFSKKLSESKLVKKLGIFLPPAIMLLVLLNSQKDINFNCPTHGIPEMVAIAVTIFIHAFKRNAFLSIVGGTALYMVMINSSIWA